MRLYLILISFLLLSCGTTHHYAPISPMVNSKTQGSFSVSYSLSDFQSIAFQLGLYFKLTEQDMIGISSQSFMIPNSISYVRLWDTDSRSGSYQFHINNFVTANHSPTYEFRYATFNDIDKPTQSYEVGLGMYATPLAYKLFGHEFPISFSPILAYQYQGEDLLFQTQYNHGYNRYKTKEILKYRSPSFDYFHNQPIPEGVKLNFEKGEIISANRRLDVYDSWVIKTQSGDSLVISNRDPYVDCFPCTFYRRHLRATLPDSSLGVYWVEYEGWRDYLVLNFEEALSNYHQGRPVDFRAGQDYIQKSINSGRFIIDDLSFSFGVPIEEQ